MTHTVQLASQIDLNLVSFIRSFKPNYLNPDLHHKPKEKLLPQIIF